MHYPLVLYFINRVLYPYVILNTTREVETFLDTTEERPDWSPFYQYGKDYESIGRELLPNRMARAVVFMGNRKDYREELKKIRETTQRMAARDDLRVAFVYKMSTIKEIKKKHPDWFGKYTTTSILLQRSSGSVSTFDISADDTDFFFWFTENSVDIVDEFNYDTIRIYEHCRTPLFLMSWPMSTQDYSNHTYVQLLNRIAKKYSEFVIFSYANASSQFIQKRKLPIKKFPGAILTFRDGSVIPYPEDWPFSDYNMDKFIELYLRRKLNKTESERKQPDFDREVYQYLPTTKLLRSENFNQTILKEGKYVMVFFFQSTSDDYKQGAAALEVNRVAEVIRDIKQRHIIISGYDLSIEPNPLPSQKINSPSIMLIYGNFGMRSLLPYEGKIVADKLLQFISENSDRTLLYDRKLLSLNKGKEVFEYYQALRNKSSSTNPKLDLQFYSSKQLEENLPLYHLSSVSVI